jgi:transmembrane sensor
MAQPTLKELQELADKWLKGTITDAEKKILDAWYNLETGEPIAWTGEDETEAELQARMLANITQNRIPVLRKRNWQLPAAAILVISLSIAAYFTLHTKQTSQPKTIAAVIHPGGNNAVLILSNGKKVMLSQASNGVVAQQTGMTITKTTNGQLVYHSANTNANDASIAYNTIQTPIGGQYQVILPDGSHVWLDAASSLRYPVKFSGNERKVELTGEAYFEVAHNKAMPFKVTSADQTITVLGTHFNIMAYSDEKAIKTTLLEGSVKVTNKTSSKTLIPGQQSQVADGNIKIANNIDLEDVTAWKDGYFKFGESLDVVMNKIARWYNVDVVYQGKPDPALAFGGKISRSRDLADVLSIMETTGKVHFKIEGRRVIVSN